MPFFSPVSTYFHPFITPPKTPYFPTGPASLLVVIRGFPPTIITITAWEPSFLVRFFHVKVDAYVLYTFTYAGPEQRPGSHSFFSLTAILFVLKPFLVMYEEI